MSFFNIIWLFLLLIYRPSADTIEMWPAEGQVKIRPNPPVIIRAGARQNAVLSFEVRKGYHIMANEMEDDNFLLTELRLAGNDDIQFSSVRFPAPEEFALYGTEGAIQVFEHTFSVEVPVSVSHAANKGAHWVDGVLFYQACDSVKCFFPRELAFQLEVRVD